MERYRDSKKEPQTSMHAPTKTISCKGIACNKTFVPQRQNQAFCGSACRTNYFELARQVGVAMLEALKTKHIAIQNTE